MDHIQSLGDLENKLDQFKKYYLLIHKSASDVSQCALKNMNDAYASASGKYGAGDVDVSQVRDIHIKYNIDTAPTLLVFENGSLSNVIKGCMDQDYYEALLKNELSYRSSGNEDGPKRKNVIVYSTPTCSWCTKIKQHLKANNITYREIDVAADPAKAEEMKRKSGQMGVPQTEIDGQMIVGFDRPKIDRLLEIA